MHQQSHVVLLSNRQTPYHDPKWPSKSFSVMCAYVITTKVNNLIIEVVGAESLEYLSNFSLVQFTISFLQEQNAK